MNICVSASVSYITCRFHFYLIVDDSKTIKGSNNVDYTFAKIKPEVSIDLQALNGIKQFDDMMKRAIKYPFNISHILTEPAEYADCDEEEYEAQLNGKLVNSWHFKLSY